MYSTEQLDVLENAGARAHRVQVKIDTGMHRVGCAPADALSLAREIERREAFALDGVFTHLAIADEPSDPYTTSQLDRFEEVLAALRAAGIDPGRVHAANSAAALAHPRARLDLVRVGIALYGIEPGRGVEHLCRELRPALSLHARVSYVKRMRRGDRIGYGLRHAFTRDTTVATVPIGYADGVPRRLFETHGHVLVQGQPCPIVGLVTMDQLMVDVAGLDVRVGEPVVLLGGAGRERVRAEDWAEQLGTVGYEVVCGISKRIERHHRPDHRALS